MDFDYSQTQLQRKTADGSITLYDPRYDEDFHSAGGAWREAYELYTDASGLVEHYNSGAPTSVLDVGLGLGYNAFATIIRWLECDHSGPLLLTSLEQNPQVATLTTEGSGNWLDPKVQKIAKQLHPEPCSSCWKKLRLRHPNGAPLVWSVFLGNASTGDWQLGQSFDFIWQDAFSPTKNSELWGIQWFQLLARSCHLGTVLMTYSVAGRVRSALENSGFDWEKIPGSGFKKHWLKAHFAAKAMDGRPFDGPRKPDA